MGRLTKQQLEERFSICTFEVDTLGCEVVSAEPGRSVVKLKVDDRHRNGMGEVMGGVIYTLADFAFAVAANYEEFATVTADSQISFYSRVSGSELIAEAVFVRDGGRLRFCETKVTDDEGNYIAHVKATGYRAGAK